MKNDDEQLPENIKEKVKNKVDEIQSWLDKNISATVEEIEEQIKNFQNFISELTSNLNPTTEDTKTESSSNGPKIEAVD
jgi:archaellum component FlaC